MFELGVRFEGMAKFQTFLETSEFIVELDCV